MLDMAHRDLLEKVFHRVRYDIDKRPYRYDVVRRKAKDEPGDFIDKYALTFELGKDQDRRAFESNPGLRKQLLLELKEKRRLFSVSCGWIWFARGSRTVLKLDHYERD